MENEKRNSILIIDDSPMIIMELTKILSSDYDVFTESNAMNAVKAANKHKPDVILLDVIMPQQDGYKTLTILRNSKETKNIPVIFITGLSNEGDEEKGLSLGAADYITKPFSPLLVKLRVENQMRMLNQLRMIERLSITDQLTGIVNRRGFDERLDLEWKRSIREQLPLSLLLLDIDKFKIYNDKFGHQQGDVALQTFARTFSDALKRASDVCARWGGEEFVALLPGTDVQGTVEVAEIIRKSIEEMEISYEDSQNHLAAKVTVSIGANTRESDCKAPIEEFISKTDAALYAAKEAGRNRVWHHRHHKK